MTDLLRGLASLAPVTLAGCLLLTLDRHCVLRPVERLALGFGLGAGVLAWEMLIFHALGLHLTVNGLLAPLLGISALTFGLARRFRQRKMGLDSNSVSTREPFQPLEWCLVVAIVLELLGAFFYAWLLPMEAYDAVSNWGLKAKAIFLAGEIPENFLLNPNYAVFHPDYPLLVPLLESYVYRSVGDLREASARVIFPLFLAGCVAVLFAALRRAGQTRRSAFVFSFLLISIPYVFEQATNGYADVVITFYFGAGSLYLYLWQAMKRDFFLVLSAVFTGFAALTKNEGLVLICIHLVWLLAALQLQSHRRLWNKLARFGIYGCVLVAVLVPWYLFRDSLGLRNDVINRDVVAQGFTWEHLSRIGPILYHLQTQVFGPKNWNMVWILLGVAVSLRHKVLFRPPVVFVLAATGLTLLVYMSVYLITPYTIPPFDVAWHLRTSASRLLLHVLPQVMFLIGLAFGEVDKA
jgi:hypothetical protein